MNHDDLLKMVRHRLRQLNMTPYQFARLVRPGVSQATVYNFVNNGRPVMSDTLTAMLTALSMKIVIDEEAINARERK